MRIISLIKHQASFEELEDEEKERGRKEVVL